MEVPQIDGVSYVDVDPIHIFNTGTFYVYDGSEFSRVTDESSATGNIYRLVLENGSVLEVDREVEKVKASIYIRGAKD